MSKNYTIRTIFLFIWTIGVLCSFLMRFPILHLFEIILYGLMLLILLLFLAALGRFAFKRFHPSWSSSLEEICFSFALGSLVMILIMIGFAIFQLLYEPFIVLVVLILYALVYQDAKYICLALYRSSCNAISQLSIQETLLLGGIVCVFIFTFLAAATPPFFYDALSYHLAVPHKYLLQHGFHFLPAHYLSNYPANLGMLFTIAMSFGGGMLAKLLAWSFAPFSALSVYAFVSQQWGRQMALIAAAIITCIPGVMIVSTLTSIDLAVMSYSFLSVYAVLLWCRSHQKQWFIYAGICCGLAVGTKYTAIVVTWCSLLILITLHTSIIKKRDNLSSVKNILLFSTLVICVLSPWLIKNMLYTGNPLFPFFNNLFQSNTSQFHNYSQVMQRIGNPVHALFYNRSWINGVVLIATSPWKATMAVYGAGGKIGIIFLLCLPWAILIKKDDDEIWHLMILIGCMWSAWVLVLPWMLRFVFPIFPLLSILSAYILWRLPFSTKAKRWSMYGLYGALIYHFLLFVGETTTILHPYSYLFSNQTTENFLIRHGVTYYPIAQWINQNLPQNAKLLIEGELRGYYYERDYLQHVAVEGVEPEKIILSNLIKQSEDIKELLQKLQQLEVSHLLINTPEMQRLAQNYLEQKSYFEFSSEKDQKIFHEFFFQYLHLLMSKHDVQIYEILYRKLDM